MLMARLDRHQEQENPHPRCHGQGISTEPAAEGAQEDPDASRLALREALSEASTRGRAGFLKAGGVFDDDQIDAYIELKMAEVLGVFEMTAPAPRSKYTTCTYFRS